MVGNKLFKLDRIETRLLLCNRRLIRYLQVVVQRIFPHPAVKFRPVHFFVEQRELRVKEPYLFIIKCKDFVFVSAHIHRIAEMIGILRLLLRIAFSHLRRFLFRRSRGEDFTASLFFGKFGSAFLLLFKPLRVNLFLLWIEITIKVYQFLYPLLDLIPIQPDMRLVITDTLCNQNTFPIVLLINACANYNGISAAPTVFLFQKIGVFLCRQALFKLLIDTELSLQYAAPTGENSVDHLLRKRKSRGLFLCLHIQKVQLPVHRR